MSPLDAYITRGIGIVEPKGALTLVRWQEKTVVEYAQINPDFIYFFVEEN